MPRLLLVDDNPSIHRIAESLLTGTQVDLVCVESGEEALRRVDGGEHFDVALLDTVLGAGGMDGWALLDRLRQIPSTSRLPIALMAGVLDAVDPLRLEKAPIQGFLRKPIELRDLEERLHAYMAVPVDAPGGHAPGAKLQDWMSQEAAPRAAAKGPGPENDLLVLTAEDLWDAEEAAHITSPGLHPLVGSDAPAESHSEPELHLEELDLETLHGTPASSPHTELPNIPSLNLDEPLSHDMLAGLEPFKPAAIPVAAAATVAAWAMAPAPHPDPEPDEEILEAPHEEPALALEPAPAAWAMAPAPVHVEPVAAEPAHAEPALESHPVAASGDANALVQALLADPAARAALIKALMAQGGEQVLREVAWEVMPDIASKMQR